MKREKRKKGEKVTVLESSITQTSKRKARVKKMSEKGEKGKR